MKRLLIFALALGIALALNGIVFAATINVPAEQPTIQAGIDAAVDGDVVLVAGGTYTGDGNKNIDFGGRAITVMSENGPEGCIIDGKGDGRGFYFHNGEGPDSVLEGFTIKGFDHNGINIKESDPIISNCNIIENTVLAPFPHGAGIVVDGHPTWHASPLIKNCSIRYNFGAHTGGGISTYECSPTIQNCDISFNQAQTGGGVAVYTGNPIFTNCTITGNTSINPGGGIYIDHYWGGTGSYFTNCVIWDNSPDSVATGRGDAFVTYCDVQGVWPGDGNIDADPLFVDSGNGDHHLRSDSPCIDAGTNDAPELPETDMDGLPRIIDGTVDMGAYEFVAHSDYEEIILADEPFCYYRLGESAVTETVKDEMGVHHGSFQNDPTIGAVGAIETDSTNAAVCFDSSQSQYVLLTTLGNFGSIMTGGFTVEYWLRTTDQTNYQTILGAANTGGYLTDFLVDIANHDANELRFYFRDDYWSRYEARFYPVGSNVNIYDDVWHHIVHVYDPSASLLSDRVVFYVDGQRQSVPVTLGGTEPLVCSNFNVSMVLAAFNKRASVMDHLNGCLDEVAFYLHSLSAAEVGKHYDTAVSENQPPVADAGPDQTIDCTCSAGDSATLDGSGSYDPDNDPLTYTWTGIFGTLTGEVVQPLLPPGVHTIIVTVDDNKGGSDSDSVIVSVNEDTTPPDISFNAPSTISPPDAPISFTATATDICDNNPSVEITEYDCFKFTKKGKKIDKKDSCVVEVAGATVTIMDSGGVDDHITWTVIATDNCGNEAEETHEVEVVNPAHMTNIESGNNSSNSGGGNCFITNAKHSSHSARDRNKD